ncbi:hypothetical protein LEP1GSC064_3702 [Leptospira kirschneri serovar Grippotyphosa str. Moskva]|nr:hypothetical protein LEP1GSC044_1628 [Leptospira kirschneri serovar Grippotyphosa str. RM52]EKQ83875.1 hypothetical protein LEP1GSC064_3702 [Leptospira kirschneri serovar Grippotyphosa str. Moskva]EKR10356.1 hypothetical protein LEP1GSC122_3877 [Leptospira kirschneri serovar Valbuzzi str. 200702274]EMK18791.1 hypothetical protein LEP1GSC042_3966 [Leptospira kirschneri serovar Bim str. PUO 1247]
MHIEADLKKSDIGWYTNGNGFILGIKLEYLPTLFLQC